MNSVKHFLQHYSISTRPLDILPDGIKLALSILSIIIFVSIHNTDWSSGFPNLQVPHRAGIRPGEEVRRDEEDIE
jgi:hypothetical protein